MTLKEYINQLQTEINLADDEFDREEMGRVTGLKYALHLAKQLSETESMLCNDNIQSIEKEEIK